MAVMCMTRESIVASTVPYTTRVSQSVISTPLSLMLGPTVSLLPPSLMGAPERAGVAALSIGAAGACTGAGAVATGAAPAATGWEAATAPGWLGIGREVTGSLGRLPKNAGCNAIVVLSKMKRLHASPAISQMPLVNCNIYGSCATKCTASSGPRICAQTSTDCSGRRSERGKTGPRPKRTTRSGR